MLAKTTTSSCRHVQTHLQYGNNLFRGDGRIDTVFLTTSMFACTDLIYSQLSSFWQPINDLCSYLEASPRRVVKNSASFSLQPGTKVMKLNTKMSTPDIVYFDGLPYVRSNKW